MDKSQFPKKQNYKYSSVRFIMLHLLNDYDMTDGVEWLHGLYEHWERDYYIEIKDLKPGKYLGYVEFDWHESVMPEQRTFSITCYGAGNTHIQNVSNQYEKQAILREAFLSKLTKSRQGIHRIDFGDKGANQVKRYAEYNYPEGYNYFIIKNQDGEATYREYLEFEKFENCEFLLPHSGMSFKISVGPLMEDIVIIKMQRGAVF